MDDKIQLSFISEETAGLYESIRVYDGVFFRLEEHLERFWESAKTVGLEVPLNRAGLRRRLEKELKDSGKKEAFVRLTLIEEVRAHGRAPLLSIIVSERTHPAEMYQKGIVLKTTVVRRNYSEAQPPEAKSTACMNQVLATLDPLPSKTYEIIFLNQEGYLTEVRIGNFFIVKDSVRTHGRASLLITPPAVGLLNGVTRRFVIECARSGKIPVEERPLTRHDLFNADEAFLTNTSWELLPIRAVDGREIGTVLPGPVTRRLQLLFRQGVEREIRKVRNGKN